MNKNTLLLLLVFSYSAIWAQDEDTTNNEIEEQFQMMLMYQQYIDSVDQQMVYLQDTTIELKDGLATVVVPEGYKFMSGDDAEMLLTDIWGNPPSAPEDKSIGMLVQESFNLNDDSAYVINITYSEEGYVSDEEAADIDYDELLEQMQEGMEAANPERIQMGYPKIELINWASAPFYDMEAKKLHWAKELEFDDNPEHTLNYSIRFLGRRGVIEMNVIGGLEVLPAVKKDIDPILASLDFNDGNKYTDFDPDVDKVAAYGIGALIAGKVAAKAGLFAKLGIILAKFWKFIAFGAVALFAGVKRFFGVKEEETSPEIVQDNEAEPDNGTA